MQDIEQIARQYSINMASTFEETLHRYYVPDYEPMFMIFTNDISKDNYFLHFNFRLVNDEISIQPKTNVGLAITNYTDRLQELG